MKIKTLLNQREALASLRGLKIKKGKLRRAIHTNNVRLKRATEWFDEAKTDIIQALERDDEGRASDSDTLAATQQINDLLAQDAEAIEYVTVDLDELPEELTVDQLLAIDFMISEETDD